jgi:hypothetical protein
MKALALAVVLATAPLAAAPAHAGILFFQDFSAGIGADEKLTGAFTVAGGEMGHTAGAYGNNERSAYDLRVDLADVTDALLSFDWAAASETNWDGWNVLIAPVGQAFDPAHPATGTPPVYNRFVSALGAPGVTGSAWSGRAIFDLTSFAGQAVDIRLQFASDYAITGKGVLFDNLVVSGTPVPEPAPGAVPEPAAWALMLTGFFGAGAAIRRRQGRVRAI